jgi:hypothetical protein
MILKKGDSSVISFGPFVDKTDGFTPIGNLVSSIDHAVTGIKISKNGGVLAVRSQPVVPSISDTYGNYRVVLRSGDVNTVGQLRMQYTDKTVCRSVWQDFNVLDTATYNSIFGIDLVQDIADGVNIVATSASLSKHADSYGLYEGSVVSGSFIDTWTENGTYWRLEDAGGRLGLIIKFDIGTHTATTGLSVYGHLNGANDNLNIYCYDFADSLWSPLGVIPGKSSAADVAYSFVLFPDHVDAFGEVLVKIADSTLTSSNFYMDRIWINYAVLPPIVGYVGTVDHATADTIFLASDASSVDGYYHPGLITVITGTGMNQYASVRSYSGLAKAFTTMTPMEVTLDNTSVIQISPWGSVRVAEVEPHVGLTDTQKTDVKSEVVNSLSTDTYANPGQEEPASTISLAKKISYVYKMLKNKIMTNSGTIELYDDTGTVVDQKSDIFDNGTSFTRDKFGSGP